MITPPIINQVEDEGSLLPFERTINIVGPGVVASDDPANGATIFTVTALIQAQVLKIASLRA